MHQYNILRSFPPVFFQHTLDPPLAQLIPQHLPELRSALPQPSGGMKLEPSPMTRSVGRLLECEPMT